MLHFGCKYSTITMRVFGIAVLFLACVVNGVPLANKDECVHGPEYWCQNIYVAKSCGAVKHCAQNVWNHITLPADDSNICDTCKSMVQQARDQLLSNETQEEIKQVFEGTCKIYFPIRVISDECIKFVDGYVPDLIEMLAERMDPQLVCATAGLCNTQKIFKMLHIQQELAEPLPKYASPTDCQDCKTFVKEVNVKLQNMTKDQLKAEVLKACDLVPQFATICRTLVSDNFNQIYDSIKNGLKPDEFCSLAGMCDETNDFPVVTSVVELFLRSRDADPECEFCQQLVEHLKEMVTANTTEAEFKDVLLGLCKSCGAYQHQCEELINEYFQEIYDFISDQLDPQMFCTALGLCTGSREETSMLKLIPATKIGDSNGFDETNDINLGSSSIQIEARVPLNKVSMKVPFSRHEHVPTVPESLQLPETRLIPQTLVLTSKPTCALCEYALHELQNMLMDNKTEEEIKQALDRVCSVLPQTLSDQCVAFINEYGDALLALLAQEVDPSQICITLKLCPGEGNVHVQTEFPSHKVEAPFKSLPKAVNNLAGPEQGAAGCETCQFIMGVVHVMLGENRTKDAIESVLRSVCNELPASISGECQSFVTLYADQLLTLLADTDPTVICSLLDLCPGISREKLGSVPIKNLKVGTCDGCELIVGYVDKLLLDPTFENDVTKVLENVCKVVPPAVRDQCITTIDTYGPYVVQLLGELADNNKVCQEIDMCPKPTGHVHLLGGKKCLYGPAYWCQSKANAKACKAEKHCSQHVWNN